MNRALHHLEDYLPPVPNGWMMVFAALAAWLILAVAFLVGVAIVSAIRSGAW